jgi:hypothetical protein
MALLRLRGMQGRGRRMGFGILASALWLAQAVPSAADPSLENAVKAAYLVKFAPFVDWPPRAFPGPASPFAICVMGADPFGGALDQAVAGQRVGDHPVVVRRLSTPPAGMDCQVLYLGRAPERRLRDVLGAVRGQPVLTVTDQGGRGPGAVIRFVLRQGRVRFAIDEIAAETNGLMISSKLLNLAATVRR